MGGVAPVLVAMVAEVGWGSRGLGRRWGRGSGEGGTARLQGGEGGEVEEGEVEGADGKPAGFLVAGSKGEGGEVCRGAGWGGAAVEGGRMGGGVQGASGARQGGVVEGGRRWKFSGEFPVTTPARWGES